MNTRLCLFVLFFSLTSPCRDSPEVAKQELTHSTIETIDVHQARQAPVCFPPKPLFDILQPSRTKLLIRLGDSVISGSGKATTRARRRITCRVEGTGPSHRFPTRSF
jgi:hypothetical protein